MTIEKVTDKIRKLYRLANDKGATENERNVALEMAQRLMLQHNIQDVQDEKIVEAIKGEWMNVDRGELWEMYVASAAAKLFNCRSVVRAKLGSHQFVGKPENIEAAGETFLFICAQIEVLYKEALKSWAGSLDKRGRAELRKTFKQACAIRVAHRVDEIVARARNDIPAHMALVVVDQSLAAADALISGLRMVKRKTSYGIGSQMGNLAGDRVQIQGGVGEMRKIGSSS
jgi:hypothetical protein